MDRFFTPKSNINLEQNTCIIEGEDVKHISRVLRCKENDKLEVCDMDNNEYICEIREINKDNILLDIIEKVNIKRESSLKVKLYQGMPKGTKMELILQKLTEIGVDEIVLVQTKRSVTKIDNKKEDKKIERWERIIYLFNLYISLLSFISFIIASCIKSSFNLLILSFPNLLPNSSDITSK